MGQSRLSIGIALFNSLGGPVWQHGAYGLQFGGANSCIALHGWIGVIILWQIEV